MHLFLEKDVMLKIITSFYCLKVRKICTNIVISAVENQQGQCDGAAALGLLLEGGSPPRGGNVRLERNARLEGKGLLLEDFRLPSFIPVCQKYKKKLLEKLEGTMPGCQQRLWQTVGVEIIFLFIFIFKFCGFFLFCV